MPIGNDDFFVSVGHFFPGDCPSIIRKISSIRVQQISSLLSVQSLHQDARELLWERNFHTFEDFIFELKNGTPKKGEYIPTGHSLNRFSPDIEGYLAYVAAHDPDLARFFFMRFESRIPEKDRKRHTYILGRSGSGKSELLKLFVYAYMRKPDYCTSIVVDPHGDMAEQIARFKEHRNTDRLIYIDPYLDGHGKKTPTINPFDVKDKSPQNIDIVAQMLVSAFNEIIRDTSLTAQMQALLVPCVTVLLHKPGSDLIELQRFMNDDRNNDLVELGKRSSNPAHRNFFTHRFYETTFRNTKAGISTKLQGLLNSHTFYNLMIGDSTLHIEEALNSRKLVIFNLSKGKLGSDTSEAFGRFIIALIQSAILKRAQISESDRVPVHIFIDEFQNYISASMEEILAESRKYGLHMTLAQQYLGQRMNTDFKRGLMANTQIKVTGMSAIDSRAAISKETGVQEPELAKLETGHFFVKVGSRPSFKLYAPGFLVKNRHSMSWEDWRGVKIHQMDKYYRVLGQTKTDSDNMDKRGSDMSEYRDNQEPQENDLTKGKKPPPKPKYTFD